MAFMKSKNSIIQIQFLILYLYILFFSISAQNSSSSYDCADCEKCDPEVRFSTEKSTVDLCLNKFTPTDDSCAEAFISFPQFSVKAFFQCDFKQQWHYLNTSIDSLKSVKSRINISLKQSENGEVSGITITAVENDSAVFQMNPLHNGDIFNVLDSTKMLIYEVSIRSFICEEKTILSKLVTDRIYSTPEKQLPKEPILNYPELSAFHWGPSIRIPPGQELQVRAYIMNYWHILTPPPIKYEDPEVIRKRELYIAKLRARHPPRPKKVRSKPPFFKINPL
jgi:hypothetical protein